MTKSDRKKLRKALPYGFTKTLADQFGFSPQYISDVIQGIRTNKKVLEAAIELAKAEKERDAKINQEIKSL